jgi:hypothetical protein
MLLQLKRVVLAFAAFGLSAAIFPDAKKKDHLYDSLFNFLILRVGFLKDR